MVTKRGTAGDDSLWGGPDGDQLYGLDGKDIIHGWGGNDYVHGGRGSDVLYGDGGNDTIIGDWGKDRLYGGDGKDTLYGGLNNDILDGGAGRDRLYGGDGSDSITVGSGDQAWGEAGYDNIVISGRGAIVHGGADTDYIQMGTPDFYSPHPPAYRGATIDGGAGGDYFALAESGPSHTTITDFKPGEDRLDLGADYGAENFISLFDMNRDGRLTIADGAEAHRPDAAMIWHDGGQTLEVVIFDAHIVLPHVDALF